MSKKILTQVRLKELLHYDPETGVFIWNVRMSNRVNAGDIAGYPNTTIQGKTYWIIEVLYVSHKAHRLACLYMTGSFPDGDTDHEDGDGLNNRWNNLRKTTRTVNCRNMRKSVRNTSGVTGVGWMKSCEKWRAEIRVCGELIYLGSFGFFNDAVIARKMAESKYGFHKNHGSERPL